MRDFSILTCIVLLSILTLDDAVRAGQKVTQNSLTLQHLTDFTEQDVKARWRTVNDNVMGGRSKGGPSFNGKILSFSGSTNTNGGGFSSIRSIPGKINTDVFTDADHVTLRVKGDGRQYKFSLRTNLRFGRMSVAYWQTFNTEKDKWALVKLPLKDFYPTIYGRDISGQAPKLDPSKIQSFGFMIYDKKDGPFKLDVDWIKVGKASSVAVSEDDYPPM